MVDSPKSIKAKKRIRSLFTPEESKLIRSKALPSSSTAKQAVEEKDTFAKKAKTSSDPEYETYRFEVDLTCDRDKDAYPEIFFSDLLGDMESDKGESNVEDEADVKKMSEYFEKKYGGVKGGMTGVRRVTDIQTDHGYDTEDPFVDDSEAFDEVIPDELDTQHGGFYINFGDLMFKKVDLSDSENEKKEKNKKRKRDEEDKKQLQKKMKSMKIKEKYKKIEKDIKLKKKAKVVVDELSGSESDHSIKSIDKPPSTVTETKLVHKHTDKHTDKHAINDASQPAKIAKESSPILDKKGNKTETKVKKVRKKTHDEKVEKKKKSKDILEEEKKKALEIVANNKPFGESKFQLISDQLARIEFELRRSHSHKKRAFYDSMLEEIGQEIDYSEFKKAAVSAFTIKNAESVIVALAPLKTAVSTSMPKLDLSYSQKHSAYLSKLEAWKSAQAAQDEGGQLIKPKGPQKHYKWDDATKSAFANLIIVKFSHIRLLKAKSDEQGEQMKQYLKTLLEEVWPTGWMSINVLLREAQPHCKPLQNKDQKSKLKVSANPLKINTKSLKPKSQPTVSKTDSVKLTPNPKLVPPKATVSQNIRQDDSVFDAAVSESPSKAAIKSNSVNLSKSCVVLPKGAVASSHKIEDILSEKDISIIKENVKKTQASLNKSNCSQPIDIPDDLSPFKSTPTPKPLPVQPPKKSILKLKPKLEKKTASSVQVFPHRDSIKKSLEMIATTPSRLICPKTTPVTLTPDQVPPNFINTLLAKYGTDKLQHLKSAGLFSSVLRQELLLLQNDAIVIIDDDIAAPDVTLSRKRTLSADLPTNAIPTSFQSDQHSIRVPPPAVVATQGSSTLMTTSSNIMTSSSNSSNLKSVVSVASNNSLPPTNTIRENAYAQASNSRKSVSGAGELTNSRPSILIKKSLTLSQTAKSIPKTGIMLKTMPKPVPVPNTIVKKNTPKTVPIPITTVPKYITAPKANLVPNTIVTNKTISPRTISVPIPNIKSPAPKISSAPLLQNTISNLMGSQLKTPNCLQTLQGASSVITSSPKLSLGNILSQNPKLLDAQTVNKSILKTVAARLQAIKDSKEKES